MQKRIPFSVLAAAFTLAASAACAEPPAVYAHIKLASAGQAPAKPVNIGGLDWTCDGDACAGATRSDPAGWNAMYFCKKVAGKFGPLASWSYRQREMSAADLAACNTAAAGVATTTAAK